MSRLSKYNDKIQWWICDEYIDLLRNIVYDKPFMWEDVAERQEELKLKAVEDKEYLYAQLHKDLRDYAQQCWHVNPLDQTEEWWANQSDCVRLLCDIEEGKVDWSDVFAEQHELMIMSAEANNLDAAIFHKKLKQYAEDVFINDNTTGIPIPGQAGNE